MAIEMILNFDKSENSFEKVFSSLKKIGSDVIFDEKFDEFSLDYKGKRVWVFLYDEDQPYIVIEFSSGFRSQMEDRDSLVKELQSFGFEIGDKLEEEQKEISDSSRLKKEIIPPYKTHQGKTYTQEEWEAYEQEQWEKYKKGKKK